MTMASQLAQKLLISTSPMRSRSPVALRSARIISSSNGGLLAPIDDTPSRQGGLGRLLPQRLLDRFKLATRPPVLLRSTSLSTTVRVVPPPKTPQRKRSKVIEPSTAHLANTSSILSSPMQSKQYRVLRHVLYANINNSSTAPDLMSTTLEEEEEEEESPTTVHLKVPKDSSLKKRAGKKWRKCSLQDKLREKLAQLTHSEHHSRPSPPRHERKVSPPLLDIIGEGSFGAVFISHYNGHKVAIKQLHDQHPRGAGCVMNKSFLNECNAFRLSHVNIVRLITFSRLDDNLVQLVYEFIGKHTLADVILNDLPLPLAQRAVIVVQVSRALAYCHSKCIVHLDVKPHNVLLYDQTKMHCKLADFGCSRTLPSIDGSVSVSRTSGGTLVYTAPEVLQLSVSSAKSDVYSLAITMWQVLSRRLLYNGLHAHHIVYMVVKRDRRPSVAGLIDDIADGRPNASTYEEIIALMERAWAACPDDRPRASSVLTNMYRICPHITLSP